MVVTVPDDHVKPQPSLQPHSGDGRGAAWLDHFPQGFQVGLLALEHAGLVEARNHDGL